MEWDDRLAYIAAWQRLEQQRRILGQGTRDGKARFSGVKLPEVDLPEGRFMVATRRGLEPAGSTEPAAEPAAI